MFIVKQLPQFEHWLVGLKDGFTRRRLARRLEKAQRGLLGDVAPVGEGVFEMREFFGPGWRVYYIQQGNVLIVMLGGGDKSTQQADIANAIAANRCLVSDELNLWGLLDIEHLAQIRQVFLVVAHGLGRRV